MQTKLAVRILLNYLSEMVKGFITTKQAADRLGVSVGRVRQLIAEGRLPAQKVGRDNLIDEKDLELVADRKPGRPPTRDKGES